MFDTSFHVLGYALAIGGLGSFCLFGNGLNPYFMVMIGGGRGTEAAVEEFKFAVDDDAAEEFY